MKEVIEALQFLLKAEAAQTSHPGTQHQAHAHLSALAGAWPSDGWLPDAPSMTGMDELKFDDEPIEDHEKPKVEADEE
jgi:hypothetical protein